MEKDLPAIGGANEPKAAIRDDLFNGPVDHAVPFRA
jgi:hypothetical protein